MENRLTVWQRLIKTKQELSLQTHLMSMDIHCEWDTLLTRFLKLESRLEAKLVDDAKHLGKVEEAFFVGNEDEINQLISEFKQLKNRLGNEAG